MSDKLPSGCMVQLLYETDPQIDGTALLGELRKHCGNVDRFGDQDTFFCYAFPGLSMQYGDGKIPPQVLLMYPDRGKERFSLDEALQQSWAWPEARQVVATCRVPLALAEMMTWGLPYKVRLNLFHNALESVLTVAPCKAIHWATSQQLVNPSAYLQARRSSNFQNLQFALNVRFYRISNRQPGEMLMDTMGLGVFGLPDLQCHFLNLDPDQVARVLYNTALYIFDQGDVIQDGHTVPGIKPTEKWKCQHEKALVGPEREVLDLNPGKPYAAGNRR